MGANNTFNPDDYGGNVQSAVSAARAAGGAVVLSSGVQYNISAPVVLDWNNAYIGCPDGMAILATSSTTINMIELGNGTNGVTVENLNIDRSTLTPAVTACGIRQNLGALSHARLENLRIEHQGIGVFLSGTDFSDIKSVQCRFCTSHGFRIYLDGATSGPGQWYWSGQNLSEKNAGSGCLVQSVGTFGGTAVGTITNLATFRNGGYGFVALGAAGNPLYSIRLADCFLGDDKLDEIYLDTYGEMHDISNCFIELGYSRGIHVSANNRSYAIRDCTVQNCSNMGIASTGADAVISNCISCGNGLGPSPSDPTRVAGNAWGLYLEGDRTVVVGGRYGNNPTGVRQNYGIVSGPGNGVLSAINLNGNLLGPTALSGTYGTNLLIP